MDIGQNIKKYRIMRGYTLDEVARKVGVSRQTMSRYETGVISNIPSDKIESIAKSLDISPALLMDWPTTWETDLYEDFRSAKTDSERRKIFERNGIPSDLRSYAEELLSEPPSMCSSVPSSGGAGVLTDEELSRISAAMVQMNDEGRERVVEYAEDLAAGGRYKKSDTDILGEEA